MPLQLPNLDDRRYQQLLDESLARIPVHTPEWTNFNQSDPGITLLQLFAFLTESLLYRCNQIPERNHKKFLQLLGVPLRPAASAQGIVTFNNERGPLETITLSEDLEVRAGQVPFRTVRGLDVLPIEARVYFKRELPARDTAVKEYYEQLYASLGEGAAPPDLKLYETVPLDTARTGADLGQGTVDHSLWIALLTRAGDKPADNSPKGLEDFKAAVREQIAGRVLNLGLVPVLTDAARRLAPGGPINPEGKSLLQYELPIVPKDGRLPADRAQRISQYRPLGASAASDVLAGPAVVQIVLPSKDELNYWINFEPLEAGTGDFPPALDDTNLNDRLLTWLRVRASAGVQATLLWANINAVLVQQRGRVTNELLPNGTGEPDQVLKLTKTPVIPESLKLTVTANGQREAWELIDDLTSAGPEVPLPDPRQPPGTPPARPANANVFALDPESGAIHFGDGTRGRRLPLDAAVRADYDYGLGREGNVGEGAINAAPALPAGFKVSNPVPTWGGAEAESVSEGEKQISRFLQHRDRLVNAMDFETIALRAPGVDIGRIEAIPAFNPELAINAPGDAPGAVTLLVIPQFDPEQPDAPRPDRVFLDSICAYLNPRRLVTTEVFLRGPIYKPIWVSVGVNVVAGFSIAVVTAEVKSTILKFLSPLPANRKELLDNQAAFLTTPQYADAQKGWPLRKAVVDRELMAVASRVPGVLSVNDVYLAEGNNPPSTVVNLAGLELPRVLGVAVVSGDAISLDELRGDAPPPSDTRPFVPVPVIPKEC